MLTILFARDSRTLGDQHALNSQNLEFNGTLAVSSVKNVTLLGSRPPSLQSPELWGREGPSGSFEVVASGVSPVSALKH